MSCAQSISPSIQSITATLLNCAIRVIWISSSFKSMNIVEKVYEFNFYFRKTFVLLLDTLITEKIWKWSCSPAYNTARLAVKEIKKYYLLGYWINWRDMSKQEQFLTTSMETLRIRLKRKIKFTFHKMRSFLVISTRSKIVSRYSLTDRAPDNWTSVGDRT